MAQQSVFKGSKLTICICHSNQCYILWYEMKCVRLFELDAWAESCLGIARENAPR